MLESAARVFLGSGGHLTWSEWAMLSPESRAAFASAGEALRQELADRVTLALAEIPSEAKVEEEADAR